MTTNDPAARQTQTASSVLLPALLMAVAGFELMARATDIHLVQQVTWGLMGAVCLLALRRLGLRDIYLLAVSVLLAALVAVTVPDAGPVLESAMDQATFLMAFILLLGLLHATAATSPSVAILGEYLTRQPPGRRYYALNGGTAFLAILFNLGIVSFLVPLIQQGIARSSPDDPLNPIRERRQISALLRGFAWCVIWSPTAFAPLIVAELMPGVNRLAWVGIGLGVYVIMLVLGGIEDSLTFRSYRPRQPRAVPRFPVAAGMRFAATTLWFLGLVVLFTWGFDETVVFGLLAACPFMVVGWLAAQIGGTARGGFATLTTRLGSIARDTLPGSVNVAITLAASGFIGRAAAALLPSAEVAAALGLGTMPDWLLLSLIPPVLAAISLLAVSPTMTAVFMGSFFAALPEMPADPTLLAFSISCGWALSMTFSPFATVVLLIERVSGIPGLTLTWRWNLQFSALAMVSLVPVFAALATVF